MYVQANYRKNWHLISFIIKNGIQNVCVFQIVAKIEDVALSAHDFWSLKDGEWLNDLVIVCYNFLQS